MGTHLLEEHTPGRYTFHDLVREYAARRARVEESANGCAAATTRLCDWYLSAVDAAALLPDPDYVRLPMPSSVQRPPTFEDYTHARSWLDEEWPNLLAIVAYAAEHRPRRVAWLLADRLTNYCIGRKRGQDWLTMVEAAMAAADAEGDVAAQASALLGLGNVYLCRLAGRRDKHHRPVRPDLVGPARGHAPPGDVRPWPVGTANAGCAVACCRAAAAT